MSAVLDEWLKCEGLRPQQIQRLLAAGVDVRDIETSACGSGMFLTRADVVIDVDQRRFEFARHSRLPVLAVAAVIVVAHDRDGEPHDLVCWRDRVLASWLGKASMLGEEQFSLARLNEPFPIFSDVLDWLRNGRYGCVPVDMKRCGPAFRDEGRLIVDDYATRAAVLGAMRVQMPDIEVRSSSRAVAA